MMASLEKGSSQIRIILAVFIVDPDTPHFVGKLLSKLQFRWSEIFGSPVNAAK